MNYTFKRKIQWSDMLHVWDTSNQYESFLRWCSSIPCFEFRFVVFNVTFNNLSVVSWRSVLLVEETGVPRENHRPVTSHWQTLSQTFHYRTALHNVPGRCSNIPLQYNITQCSGTVFKHSITVQNYTMFRDAVGFAYVITVV
jgi:hypothetical protein